MTSEEIVHEADQQESEHAELKSVSLSEARQILAENKLRLDEEWSVVTLKEARQMLADEHGVTIREEEDPIRMLYTLIKVFLVNQEQLLDSQRIKYAEQVEATSGATLGLALDLVREFAEKLPEINQGTQAIQQESAPQQSQIRSIPLFVYFLMFLVVVLMLLLVGVMKGIF